MGYMKDLLIRIRSGSDESIIEAIGELLPRWIPVGERLPDDESEVLVCFADRSLGVTAAVFRHVEEDGTPKWTDGDHEELKQPTHWMPLPEPPEVK